MSKKRLIRFVIWLIIVCFIGYFLAFIINNYYTLKNKSDIGIHRISVKNLQSIGFETVDSKLVSFSDNPSFKYDFDDFVFVKKIIFKYRSENNLKSSLILTGLDTYGKANDIVIESGLNKNINVYSELISNKVSSINVDFNAESPIEIFDIVIDNRIDFWESSFIFYIIIAVTILFLVYFKKLFCKKIEYLFLALSLSFGLTVLFIHQIDLGKSWDDQIHFTRAYGLVNENHTSSSLTLTDVLSNNFSYFNTDEEREAFIHYLNKNNVKVDNEKTYVGLKYDMVSYIPQSIIFAIGNLLSVPFSVQFSLGMLVNLLIYISVVFLAIRKTPFGKHLMLVISLMPTALFLASSYSYDPTVTAFIMLGLSYYLYEQHNRGIKLSSRNVLIMMTSFVIAACPKAIYAPFLLLLLTFDSSKFNSKKQKKTFNILIILLTLLFMSTFLFPMISGTMGSDLRGGDTSIVRQLSLIIHQPVSFIKVFYKTAGLEVFNKFFSKGTFFSFAYLGLPSSDNSYYLYFIGLLLSVFINSKCNLRKSQKIILFVITFIVYCTIWGTMYLAFTPVGTPGINGVQNRYFIPLLFGILLVIRSDRIKINIDEEILYVLFATLLTITTFSPLYDLFL